jgi:hypothetical protein
MSPETFQWVTLILLLILLFFSGWESITGDADA